MDQHREQAHEVLLDQLDSWIAAAMKHHRVRSESSRLTWYLWRCRNYPLPTVEEVKLFCQLIDRTDFPIGSSAQLAVLILKNLDLLALNLENEYSRVYIRICQQRLREYYR